MNKKQLIWMMPLVAILSILTWQAMVIAPTDRVMAEVFRSLGDLANSCLSELISCQQGK